MRGRAGFGPPGGLVSSSDASPWARGSDSEGLHEARRAGPPMNVRILIDGIVRQTTVLIAQLATSGGLRAPWRTSRVRCSSSLPRSSRARAITKKVTADMFGMALRSYQRRTQHLSQSATDRGRSLWEALLDYTSRSTGPVTRDEIFRRFRHDGEPSLRGVLRDLTESGVAFSSGSGSHAVYRLASKDELGKFQGGTDGFDIEALVWSMVFREGPLTIEHLGALVGIAGAELEPVLSTLVASGRVERTESAGVVEYHSSELLLGLEGPAGWEAAVLDHFLLPREDRRSKAPDRPEGVLCRRNRGAYHLTLFRGHPMEEEGAR